MNDDDYTDNFWAEPSGLRNEPSSAAPVGLREFPATAERAVAIFAARVRSTWWIEHRHLNVQASRAEERESGWWLPLGARTGTTHAEDEAFYHIGRRGDASLAGQPLWWSEGERGAVSRVRQWARELLSR